MKTKYKGFEIEAYREGCLAGYDLLYFTVYDQDGGEWISSFEDSEEKVRDKIKDLKSWVDDFYNCLEKKICVFCGEELAPTMMKNLYCEDCDEYYEIQKIKRRTNSMLDKNVRLCFEDIKCPYCGDAPGWLFATNDTGTKIVDCVECGETFVAEISVEPVVNKIYKMVEV